MSGTLKSSGVYSDCRGRWCLAVILGDGGKGGGAMMSGGDCEGREGTGRGEGGGALIATTSRSWVGEWLLWGDGWLLR